MVAPLKVEQMDKDPKENCNRQFFMNSQWQGTEELLFSRALAGIRTRLSDEIEQAQTVVVAMETRETSWSGLI